MKSPKNRQSLPWRSLLLAAALWVAVLLVSCDVGFTATVHTKPPAETTAREPAAMDTDTKPTEDVTTDPDGQTDVSGKIDPDSGTDGSDPVGTEDPSAPADTDSEPAPDTPEESAGEVTDPPAESETQSCAHTPVALPAENPSCTRSGKTEGSVCGDCGAVLIPQTEIPPTGHSYTDFLCDTCGLRALCPAPAFAVTEGLTVAFGEYLTLSWSLTDPPLFDAVYTLTMQEAGCAETAVLTDSPALTHTLTFPREDTVYTLRLRASYASPDGTGDSKTASEPAVLQVTVPLRPRLEAPAFITGDMSITYAGKGMTVAWTPVEQDGSTVYSVTLTDPDGVVTVLAEETETTSAAPDGDLLAKEGIYLVTVTAKDLSQAYRDSPAAVLRIQVKSAEAEAEDAFYDPLRYASDHYYDFLATQEKGTALRLFYEALDKVLTDFHSSEADAETVKLGDGTTRRYAAKMDYNSLGLTLEEAVAVRFCYVYDHPLYYWISNYYVYSGTHLYFCVEEEYAEGTARVACNRMIYDGAREMAASVRGESSPYHIALAYYELLPATADYAYEEDGETPQDDPWAHSIVGLFDPNRRGVVCEGFAEAYSLMLNFHGVENIQVPGVSRGVGHLWNLIRMDNGEWYWCDVTWDDHTYSPLGTDYKYFCVTDTADVLYYHVRDGIEAGYDYTFTGSATFLDDHTVQWDPNLAMDMTAAIPARAHEAYSGTEPVLRRTFTVDGMTYAVVGYNKVQLVDVGSKGRVTVPESVTYGGRVYTVCSIGLISEDGIYMKGRLLPLLATSVFVPKTVSYIWDGALSGFLVNITVDPENPYYTVKNGQLVAKG